MPRIVLLMVLACGFSATCTAAEANKPNVVIIFIDDLGYADIGPYGATKQKTPQLDRMAREGMKLTSFYAAPVCSVSRAQLLTGCYGVRVSVPGVFFPAGKQGLHPQEVTLAERLKEQGYATQCVGKWHLGDQPEFLPTKQGFDHYFGIPYSNDMEKKSAELGEQVVPLLRDDKVLELLTEEAQSRVVERYTEVAVDFIRQNKERPFFLYLPHTAVHTPIHAGAAFVGKSSNGRFGDWVEEVDWSVGRVLDTLRELKLDQNTLVVFTSDNGPWLVRGPDGGSAGPLRNGKGTTWEGGVRVPTLAWWPGKIAAGSACDAVAGTIDLLPTTVAIAGGKVPAEPVIDGRDISPLLFGQSTQSPREAHYYFHGYNLQAVRQGEWKLVLAVAETLEKNPKPNAGKSVPHLFHLKDDIGETKNLASQHPEIVLRLQALAANVNAEIGGPAPKARRPPGEVEHPVLLYPGAANPPPAMKEKSKAKPVALDRLQPGDAITSSDAPQVANQAFTISCVVESDQPNAVVLAHGGMALGYALHLKAGRVAFAVRTGDDSLSEICSAKEIKGATRITTALAENGAMSLVVNDEPAVTGKAASLIPNQPFEDFCLGHDNGQPLAEYAGKDAFRGTVRDLKIATP